MGLRLYAHSDQKQTNRFAEIFQEKAYLRKTFEREISIRKLPTTFHQIFCRIIFNYHAIVKNIIDQDDHFRRTSEQESMG